MVNAAVSLVLIFGLLVLTVISQWSELREQGVAFEHGCQTIQERRIRIGDRVRAGLVEEVVAVGKDTITFDGNHPLAGKDLTFEIELMELV